jgi:hypothetical protein
MSPIRHSNWRSRSVAFHFASFVVFAILPESTGNAGQPPVQEPVATTLGPKAYRDGDVIEITNVTSTSRKLEQGDSVTVSGRVRLESQKTADLCLFLTQTQGSGKEEVDRGQTVRVARGMTDFVLKTTIKHRGVLHLTMYDPKTGHPLGGTYFGNAEQMKKIADWNLAYYLPN